MTAPGRPSPPDRGPPLRALLPVLLLLLSACAARGPRLPGPLAVVTDVRRAPEVVAPPVVEPLPEAGTETPPPPRRARAHGLADRVADEATALLGGRVPKGWRDDCSGFVASAAARAGLTLSGGTADLHERAKELGVLHHRKEPERGDLVFFDRTYDRDGNGRLDDVLTHVGVVIEVLPDGTVRVAHRADAGGLSVLHLNLHHPDAPASPDGQVWNDPLRRSRGGADKVPTLAGGLWSGFATLRDGDLDRWTP